ncbi:hypothetical protein PAXRUDRAFT_163007 [Paxillus rubicundulus Ve08.2h10]|uniref:RNA polymerase II-associated protein 1 C-terminal domain-containing protein n=1 Tax=Paxillus rubicundulus Ve08.2h10 TaxID=930991 RepID=A0A0D0DDH7_9AGAM|nr:hypothetical protein PAXRUDRAFT_163007 [Paxillus rubicundulus Ve08.2h10]
MSANDRSLIGSVFERKTLNPPPLPSSRFGGTPGTGFPAVQHRSKSAFARAREEAKGNAGARLNDVPSVTPTQQQQQQSPFLDTKPISTHTYTLRHQISEENERKIANMTDEEIEKEKQEILEQLGSGAGALLSRIREERQRKSKQKASISGERSVEGKVNDISCRETEHGTTQPKPIAPGLGAKPGVLRVKSLENLGQTASSRILAARSSTRPSSRTSRILRFAEVTPNDVHVYESAPVSPKRTAFALPPPPDIKDDSIISLSPHNGYAVPMKRTHPTDSPTSEKPVDHPTKDNTEPEEGTPEYIRRRYFPNILVNDPSLAWIEPPSSETDSSAPRFDLHGAPMSASLSATLPSHLGLHHHAEGNHAGYTIEDVFLLSRSTVPAQRTSMLSVLAQIARRLGQQVRRSDCPERITEFTGKEGELRKRILATGLAALDQIGSLGARAVEVVWECLVEWDKPTSDFEGVELMLAHDVVSSLHLDYFLPQVADVLSQAALPRESLAQLLAIIHRLAQESNELAETITKAPRLLSSILQTFILTPIPPRDELPLPNPLALQLLVTLASASRSNASALVEPADALLRFLTLLPPSSTFPISLAVTLLTLTLRFYTVLASYGLYSHIATTASQYFAALGTYVLSTQTRTRNEVRDTSLSSSSPIQLRITWASLVEAWIVCATDPHATSPPHEVLWSQVCAWGWATEVRKLREGLGKGESDWGVWAAVWSTEAAWLEGSRINGVRGGEGERKEALKVLAVDFAAGLEFEVVRRALEAVHGALAGQPMATGDEVESRLKAVASPADVLSSALRLWLACLPPPSDGISLSSPPFPLPFNDISAFCAVLVKHPVWSLSSASGTHLQLLLRPLTSLLVQFHRVSRHIPGTTPQLWVAQDLVFLPRLLPGDEAHVTSMLDALSLATPQFAGIQPYQLPKGIIIDILKPFFEHTIRPDPDVYIAPLHPSTESIAKSTTLRLPGCCATGGVGGEARQRVKSGLPLSRDWLTAPLTHLLRSGTSPVFRALPASWAASEVDVVRATLFLLYAARMVLADHGLSEFILGPAEVVFACMRVCMLEHGVGSGTEVGEVFRDGVVEKLMGWLLEPYTPCSTSRLGLSTPASTSTSTSTSTPASASTFPSFPHVNLVAETSFLFPLTPQTHLELASLPYLQPTNTPFYQFYTDLVALYSAISFAHPIFGALLLPPLAMRYAGDYRRLFWCESGDGGGGGGDIVRSVRVGVEGVVGAGFGWEGWDKDRVGAGSARDLREYLYPPERDGRLLGAYIQSLNTTQGFLRLVAVHHVACGIWPDLGVPTHIGAEDDAASAGDGGAKILRALLVRGDADAVRAVLLYRQSPRGAFICPPACYEGGGDGGGGENPSGWRAERLEYVRRSLGDEPAERVKGVFTQN